MLEDAARTILPISLHTPSGDFILSDLYVCGLTKDNADMIVAFRNTAFQIATYFLQPTDCISPTGQALTHGASNGWVAVAHASMTWQSSTWTLSVTVNPVNIASTTPDIGAALSHSIVSLQTDNLAVAFLGADVSAVNIALDFQLYGATVGVFTAKPSAITFYPHPMPLSPNPQANSYVTMTHTLVSKLVRQAPLAQTLSVDTGPIHLGSFTGLSYSGGNQRVSAIGTFHTFNQLNLGFTFTWTGATDLLLSTISFLPDPACGPIVVSLTPCGTANQLRTAAETVLNAKFGNTPFRPIHSSDTMNFMVQGRPFTAHMYTYDATASSDAITLTTNLVISEVLR